MRREFSLGELLTLQRRPVTVEPEQEYAEIGVRSFGKGIFHKLPRTGLEVGDKELYLVKEGDFILQITFAWEGAVGLASAADDGMYCSVRFPTFRINEELCDPKYLLYYFRTPDGLRQLGNISPGSAGRNRVLSVKRVPEIIIYLPPVSDQRHIVTHIEALVARIAEARGLRQQAVAEAEAFWYSSLQQTRHELLMGGWEVKQIGELASVTSGGTPSREVSAYWNGEIPWIKTGELIDGDILGAEEFITEDGLNNSSTKLFPIETILIALYGQGQTRGRTGRLMIEAATNQACCAILPTERFDSRFLQYWIRSLYSEMREVAHGGAQPNWNSSTIKRIEVPLLPLSEQHYVVAHLDDLHARVDALKRLQADTAAELDALLPAVLDRAFRGEL